jgi:hypothetical protein
MIFWWFFDDFLGFVWFSLLKQNLQKSSKNHPKIIIFLSLFFFIRLKIIIFYRCFYHSVCPLRTPASIPRNFFVSKSSWQTCWRWLSQGLNSARLPCTWTLGTWCQDI